MAKTKKNMRGGSMKNSMKLGNSGSSFKNSGTGTLPKILRRPSANSTLRRPGSNNSTLGRPGGNTSNYTIKREKTGTLRKVRKVSGTTNNTTNTTNTNTTITNYIKRLPIVGASTVYIPKPHSQQQQPQQSLESATGAVQKQLSSHAGQNAPGTNISFLQKHITGESTSNWGSRIDRFKKMTDINLESLQDQFGEKTGAKMFSSIPENVKTPEGLEQYKQNIISSIRSKTSANANAQQQLVSPLSSVKNLGSVVQTQIAATKEAIDSTTGVRTTATNKGPPQVLRTGEYYGKTMQALSATRSEAGTKNKNLVAAAETSGTKTRKAVVLGNQSRPPQVVRNNSYRRLVIAGAEAEANLRKTQSETGTPKQKVETPATSTNVVKQRIADLGLDQNPGFKKLVPSQTQLEAVEQQKVLKEERQKRNEEKLERLQNIENAALEKVSAPSIITVKKKYSLGDRIRVFIDKAGLPEFLRPSSEGEAIYGSKKIEKEGEKNAKEKSTNFGEKIERILEETPIYEKIEELGEKKVPHPNYLLTLGKTQETYLAEQNSYNMKKRQILLTKLSEFPGYEGTIDLTNPKNLNKKTLMEIVKKGSVSNIEDIKQAKENLSSVENDLMNKNSTNISEDVKKAISDVRDKEADNFRDLFIPDVERYGKKPIYGQGNSFNQPPLVDKLRRILYATPIFTNPDNFTIIEKAKELNMTPADFMEKVNSESMALRKSKIDRISNVHTIAKQISVGYIPLTVRKQIDYTPQFNILEGNEKYSTEGITSLIENLNPIYFFHN